MKAELDELLALTGQHIGQYETMIELLNQEQAALIALDLDRLQATAKAKETTVLKMQLTAPGLTRAAARAASALGLVVDEQPTLSDLAAAAPQPWSGRLQRAGLMLVRLKRNISSHSRANQTFIQESLDLVSGRIAILTGTHKPRPQGYLASGKQAASLAQGPVRLSREI